MSNPKRFYWLKLKEDFFDEKYIKALRKLPQGDSLVIVYLKMQLKSLKTEGIIKYDNVLPTAEEELALLLDEDETVVQFTIQALIKMGVVEKWDDDVFYLAALQNMIGSESDAAERVRRHRNLHEKTQVLHCNAPVTVCNTEKEIEKDIDIDDEEETRARVKFFLPEGIQTDEQKKAELQNHFESLFYKLNEAQKLRIEGFFERYGDFEVYEVIEETARRDVQKPLAYMNTLLKQRALKNLPDDDD